MTENLPAIDADDGTCLSRKDAPILKNNRDL